jgi:hypothetical protein
MVQVQSGRDGRAGALLSQREPIRGWLPPGRTAAVCLSVDDVSPARSTDDYEAGGDLLEGVLGRLEWLLNRHPQLRVTLFVCPDWRERSPVPTRRRLARIPVLRDHLHLTPPRRGPDLRIDRHPDFARHLREHPRYEVALHGLRHLARGRRPPLEFERASRASARRRLRRAQAIFASASLPYSPGLAPPGWSLSESVAQAAADARLTWVSAARDLVTPIADEATTAMSGPHGLSLLYPHRIASDRLVHVPVNWQATSDDERALAVLDHGGVLSIKAHAVKCAFGHIALDGLDVDHCARLDRLFSRLTQTYGDSLWWTTLGALAERSGEAAIEHPAVRA